MLSFIVLTIALLGVGSCSTHDGPDAKLAAFPEMDLLERFFTEHHCLPEKVLGNHHALIEALSTEVDTEAIKRQSERPGALNYHCAAVLMLSANGLDMKKVEELTFGSFRSLIIGSGTDHLSLDTKNSLRPIYYFHHGDHSATMHVYCPGLHGKGLWLLNQGVWIKSRGQMLYLNNPFNLCPSPLKDAEVDVAFIERSISKLQNFSTS